DSPNRLLIRPITVSYPSSQAYQSDHREHRSSSQDCEHRLVLRHLAFLTCPYCHDPCPTYPCHYDPCHYDPYLTYPYCHGPCLTYPYCHGPCLTYPYCHGPCLTYPYCHGPYPTCPYY